MNLSEIKTAQAALVATKFDEATKAQMSKNAQFLVGNTNGLKEGETLSFEGCKVMMMSFDINGTKTAATPCVMAIRTKLDGEMELFQLSLASLKRQSYGKGEIAPAPKAGTFPTLDVQNIKFSIKDNADLTKDFICEPIVVVAPEVHYFALFATDPKTKQPILVDGKQVVDVVNGIISVQGKKTTIFATK